MKNMPNSRKPARGIIITAVNLMLAIISSAQTIIPPSPKAASFHVYGDIPVSHSTGVPDISIPLYTIDSEGVEIPIGLKYHIGSLKPLEPNFSDVGWGWTLEYGGRVSRTILDNPDELMEQSKDIRNSNDINENLAADYEYLRQSEQYLVKELGNDTEYDLFNIASFGRYGKFIINKEGGIWKPYAFERNPGKIELGVSGGNSLTNEIIERISLTDEFGIKYIFGNGKIEKTSNNGNYQEHCPLSWLISSIESDYGKELATFEYADIPTLAYAPENAYISVQNDNPVQLGEVNAGPSSSPNLPGPTDINVVPFAGSNVPTTAYFMKTISKINFIGGAVEFDLDEDNRFVQAITIRNSSGSQLTRFNFVYSVFANLPTEFKRLDEVIVLDSQDSHLYSYTFEYENAPDYNAAFVPPGIDYWGFFRGGRANAAEDLNPSRTIEYFPWNGSLSSFCTTTVRGEGTRSANFNSYAYALTKITYPTHGYTEFVYGLNQYDKILNYCSAETCGYTTVPMVSGGGFRVQSITNKDYDGRLVSRKQYLYEPGFINLDVFDAENYTQTKFNALHDTQYSGSNPGIPLTDAYHRFRSRTLSSSLRSGLHFDGVYYQTVTEYNEDLLGNSNGKVVYEYVHPNQSTYLPISQTWTTFHPLRSFVDASGSCDIFENFRVPYQIRGFGSNQLRKIRYYHRDETGYFNDTGLMKEEVFSYGITELNSFSNLRFYTLCSYGGNSPGGGPSGYGIRMDLLSQSPGNQDLLPLYIHHNYEIVCGTYHVLSKTVTDYSKNGNAIVKTETYTYNEKGLPSTVTILGSDQQEHVIEKHYIFENVNENVPMVSVKNEMVARNIIGIPLIEKTYNGTALTDGIHRKFNFINNQNNQVDNNILRLEELQKLGNGSYYAKEAYLKYHSGNGKIIEERSNSGITISYVWSYDLRYPVFKIENADYTTVNSQLSAAEKSVLSGTPTTADIQAIHENLAQNLPKSSVYGYIFKPLYGVEMVIDPNGNQQSYVYDAAGRLKYVKDKDDHIIKSFDYVFRTH